MKLITVLNLTICINIFLQDQGTKILAPWNDCTYATVRTIMKPKLRTMDWNGKFKIFRSV